jgi:hypothetical protein
MELINPSPQVFARRETDRKAVSAILLQHFCILCRYLPGSCARLLHPEAEAVAVSCLQKSRQELAQNLRDPIDALEIFEVSPVVLLTVMPN